MAHHVNCVILSRHLTCQNLQIHRLVSSLISKKRQAEINARKRHENRRIKKVQPGHDEDLPVYTFANTSKNPTSNIYAWGMACFGALGNPEFIYPPRKTLKPVKSMHHPVRVSKMELKKVKDVACGYGYSVFAAKDKDCHLFGTGINNMGQIGYHQQRAGHPLEVLIAPSPIKVSVVKIKQIKEIFEYALYWDVTSCTVSTLFEPHSQIEPHPTQILIQPQSKHQS